MSRKWYDVPSERKNFTSEELHFTQVMGMTLRTLGATVPSSKNPNHDRNICVLWSLGCIGELANFFTSEYQGRLRQALINKFAIGGTTSIVQFIVYADTTKLTVPDVNFPRPVPLDGYKLTLSEDWTFTIYHSTNVHETALLTLRDAMLFSSLTEAAFLCIVSDAGYADYVFPKLKGCKFALYDLKISEECMRKRPADRLFPLPAECTSYYGPLEILKDCIKRTQKKYNTKIVRLNSVRQLFDQLSTGEEFGKIYRDAENAGVIAVTRAAVGSDDNVPVAEEAWSVTVRFNPSFKCYDQLNAFRLDPDEQSLQVSTKPERRGNWQCMTIQPFDTRDDAEEFFSARLAALIVKPKFEITKQGTEKELEKVSRDAEYAGVIAGTRADGRQWISLTAAERNEVVEAVECVPPEEEAQTKHTFTLPPWFPQTGDVHADVRTLCEHFHHAAAADSECLIYVLWSLRRIGPSSDFFTVEYQARLHSDLTAQFERDGVAPIIALHVYADTAKVTVPVENFIRPVPKEGSKLKYTLTTGETWTTKIYHCETPVEIAEHFEGHSKSLVLAQRNAEDLIICTVSDDDECGCLVADVLNAGGSTCQHYHVNVSEECMRKRPADRSLPMPAECTSYYSPRKILKDCIKRTTQDNTESDHLTSVRQLFDQFGTGKEFESVCRDAENAGVIAVTQADGKQWISLTPVKWGEWDPTEDDVPADVSTLWKRLRQEEADRRTRELCQSFANAERNRDSIIKEAQEIEKAHIAQLLETRMAEHKKRMSKASKHGGERLQIERETVPSALRQAAADAEEEVVQVEQTVHRETVPGNVCGSPQLRASQPIEYETWSDSAL